MKEFFRKIVRYLTGFFNKELKFIEFSGRAIIGNRNLFVDLSDINDYQYSLDGEIKKLTGKRLTFKKIITECNHKIYVSFYKNTESILAAVIEYTNSKTGEVTRYYYICEYYTTPKEREWIKEVIKKKFHF